MQSHFCQRRRWSNLWGSDETSRQGSPFLAEYRSYRDRSTMDYLNGIGFRTDVRDRVYTNHFGLPRSFDPNPDAARKDRPVVRLGVMVYAGKISPSQRTTGSSLAYLKNLTFFVKSLLAHGYDVRLLSGDIGDVGQYKI